MAKTKLPQWRQGGGGWGGEALTSTKINMKKELAKKKGKKQG